MYVGARVRVVVNREIPYLGVARIRGRLVRRDAVVSS